MEKHVAQDCQSVDELAKQEMSQLLMTKRLQVISRGWHAPACMHLQQQLCLAKEGTGCMGSSRSSPLGISADCKAGRVLLQNLEKKGLKRRAEAAVDAAPALLENANSSYAIPEHHRSYGGHTLAAAHLCADRCLLPMHA